MRNRAIVVLAVMIAAVVGVAVASAGPTHHRSRQQVLRADRRLAERLARQHRPISLAVAGHCCARPIAGQTIPQMVARFARTGERLAQVAPATVRVEERFGLFRTASTAAAGGPSAAFANTRPGQTFGLNPGLSRKAGDELAGDSTRPVWVIPGQGVTCLDIAGSLGGLSCATTDSAAAGQLQTILYAAKGLPANTALVSGLVPNGVGSVQVSAAGATTTLSVTNNLYSGEVPDAGGAEVTVTFTEPGGATVTVPQQS